MVRAFTGNMRARVGLVADWSLVRRGVAISIGKFAIIELPIDEFEEGDSLLRVRDQPCVEGMAHYLGSGPLLFVGDDEAHLEIGVMDAS